MLLAANGLIKLEGSTTLVGGWKETITSHETFQNNPCKSTKRQYWMDPLPPSCGHPPDNKARAGRGRVPKTRIT